VKDTFFSSKFAFNSKGILHAFEKPLVMGILNVTPDSFYENSRVQSLEAILNRAGQMIQEGAAILDIGGYSSRPGATDISIDEEIQRVVEPIEAIKKAYPDTLISVDTFRSKVAEAAIGAGGDLVNDISGGQLDKNMFHTVAKLNCPYILMHMRGTPQNMMQQNDYDDLISAIIHYFSQQILAAEQAGVKDIIIDPGFGFSKNVEQNYELMRQLDLLHIHKKPILVGISRKSMIYKKLGITAENSLNGTTTLNTIALMKGAQILRVHDVREAVEVCQIMSALD
jgi:dihydropteroate synthase